MKYQLPILLVATKQGGKNCHWADPTKGDDQVTIFFIFWRRVQEMMNLGAECQAHLRMVYTLPKDSTSLPSEFSDFL